ncbi:DUF3565 domain-containing protein [Pseudomonas fulva]|uniref:DUF3565 domain-containing protein n=1 Tax=Pseudomonas fulva TaxID=47880 RepID=UPI00201E32F3|nr:DUF3565 domain-containing protein [Pseudomonas fulva]UQY35694.1 DUF3565 domain-containing protein [Pseudomonas fulva]
METALLAAICMGANLLLEENERESVTNGGGESDPSPDGRAASTVTLVGFEQDHDGHWVAALSCGHTQHLRHQPPWQNRPWVLDAAQRHAHIGTNFTCGWCVATLAPTPPDAKDS